MALDPTMFLTQVTAAALLRAIESSKLSWTLVRNVGESRILTKLSYTSLLIVPILAAVWPAVRVGVNQYVAVSQSVTRSAEEAAAEIDKAVLSLEEVVLNTRQSTDVESIVDASLMELSRALRAISVAADSLPLPDPDLPLTWAALFFGALSVVIGHSVYQFRAPESVRQYSAREYSKQAVDDYFSVPADHKVELAAAKLRVSPAGSDLLELIQDTGNSIGVATYTDGLEKFQREKNAGVIEAGAHFEYAKLARSSPWAILVSLLLYCFAIAAVVIVVAMQIKAVLVAAGLLSGL